MRPIFSTKVEDDRDSVLSEPAAMIFATRQNYTKTYYFLGIPFLRRHHNYNDRIAPFDNRVPNSKPGFKS